MLIFLKDTIESNTDEIFSFFKHRDKLEKLNQHCDKITIRTNMYTKMKRIIDIIISLIGLVVISPLLLVIIILIKIDSKGPVIFKQKRIKKGKKYFDILKFRTMSIYAPKNMPTHLLNNPDEWITRIGNILRKTSLDELPQLWNIFKGDMSFVGPRPALWNQFDLIEEREKYGANDIPVGLTGWAQINGRDDLPIAVKAKFDGAYVKEASLFFDIVIVFKTIFYAISGKGIKEGSK